MELAITWNIGASASLLTATMTLESLIPAKCWMAPEIPNAIYNSGATIFPVWPTYKWTNTDNFNKSWEVTQQIQKNVILE